MKIETRTIYIAEDGTEFSEQSKCEKYEKDGCVHLTKLPKFGDHFELTPELVDQLMHGDGSLYYATADRMSRVTPHRAPHPEWATHLVYFGK